MSPACRNELSFLVKITQINIEIVVDILVGWFRNHRSRKNRIMFTESKCSDLCIL